ncbi:MAG: acyltransferase family protein [Methyloprofundus sp.]|nr:acyltransferase family protein [Methyloprofundus sp.]
MTKDHVHIKGLNGLRAMAALAVFANHYGQIIFVDQTLGYFDLGVLLENGNVAVSLFFTLSGFLLSLPFWSHLLFATACPKTTTYLLHRLARIAPAYYLCLTLLICFENGWQFALSHPDVVLHYMFLFNFTEFSIFSINSVFWTLAVEMQFYFLLPLLFIILRKLPKQPVILLLLIILASYILNDLLIHTFKESIDWPWDTKLLWIRVHGAVLNHSVLAHLPHFLSGVCAASFVTQQATVTPYKKHYDLIFCAACLLLISILSTPIYEYILIPAAPYGFPITSILLVLIILSTPQSLLAVKILDSLLFRKLGTLSYGFYLYHLPVFNYLYELMQNFGYSATVHWFVFIVSSFIVTLMIAFISYRMIEQPILRKIKHHPAQKLNT